MPDIEPVVPRPAATVLLLRDAPDPGAGRTPLQVFMQRRTHRMAFAGGMTVFPGGGVAPGDRVGARAWTGPAPQEWAARFGLPEEIAEALVGTAVRETFEECGVLLATSRTGSRALPDDQLRARERAALVARSRTLETFIAEHDLVLRADLLQPWARWVTPEGGPRRYDTAFFVTRIPDGEQADACTTEAEEAGWWHPADVLERHRAGELELLPPTLHNLRQLAEHDHVESVLTAAQHRVIETVRPTVRRHHGQVVVEHSVGSDVRFSYPVSKPPP